MAAIIERQGDGHGDKLVLIVMICDNWLWWGWGGNGMVQRVGGNPYKNMFLFHDKVRPRMTTSFNLNHFSHNCTFFKTWAFYKMATLPMLAFQCYYHDASATMLSLQCYCYDVTVLMLPARCHCPHATITTFAPITMLLSQCYRCNATFWMLPSQFYHPNATFLTLLSQC